MNFELDNNDVNLIINTLSELPYKQVFMLIHKINQQFIEQMQKKQEGDSFN